MWWLAELHDTWYRGYGAVETATLRQSSVRCGVADIVYIILFVDESLEGPSYIDSIFSFITFGVGESLVFSRFNLYASTSPSPIMGSSKTDRAAKLAKLAEGLASTSPKEDVGAAVEKRLEARLNKLQTEFLMASISDLRERVRGV